MVLRCEGRYKKRLQFVYFETFCYVYDAKNSEQIKETLKDLVNYRIVGEGV